MDFCELEASLIYIMNSRPAKAAKQVPEKKKERERGRERGIEGRKERRGDLCKFIIYPDTINMFLLL